jgi:hypothetical protein
MNDSILVPASAARILEEALDDLEKLRRAYDAIRSHRAPGASPDTLVGGDRMSRLLGWSEAFDRLRTRGLRPLLPDGSSFDAMCCGVRVRFDRDGSTPGSWSARCVTIETFEHGLRARFPWLRVV